MPLDERDRKEKKETYDLVETLSGTQTSRASANDEDVNGTEEEERKSAWTMAKRRFVCPYMSGWVILP